MTSNPPPSPSRRETTLSGAGVPPPPQASLPAPATHPALPEHTEPNRPLPPLRKPATPPSPPPARPPAARKRGIPFWVWIIAVVVVLAAVYFITKPKADAAGAGKGKHGHGGGMLAPVTAVKAVQGDIGVYDTGLGSVTPLATVTVKSQINGTLTQLFFTEGQTVKAGDPLVEIDPRPYQVALEQAEGQLAKDQALLDNAKLDLQRYATLLKQDSIAQQTYATQVSLVAQDEGVVKTDQASVDSAKLNLVYCHITSPIDGKVGLRLVDLGNYVQTSDASGLLVITQLQPITVIFTVAEDQVPAIIKQLNAGEKLEVDAYDRDMKNQLAKGTLLSLDNQIDPTTGTLKIKASFPNQDNALFPNQFVNAKLLVSTEKNVVLVPVAAIQRGPTNNSFVYIVKESAKNDPTTGAGTDASANTGGGGSGDQSQGQSQAQGQGGGQGGGHPLSTVSVREVTVGVTEGDTCEILKGIDAGETVVIDGVDKLQDGAKVTVQMKK